MSSFIQAFDNEDDPDVEGEEIVCNAVYNCIDPPNCSAAMKTAAAERWKIAIEDELKSLRDNRSWVVVEKPPDVKPLASRFVFKLKLDSNGAVERYNARLVARGDQQFKGVNYKDTFSPVMDMATARIIFAFGVIWGNPPRHGYIPVAYTKSGDLHVPTPRNDIERRRSEKGGNRTIQKLMKNLYSWKTLAPIAR
jgi:hypothetical protein